MSLNKQPSLYDSVESEILQKSNGLVDYLTTMGVIEDQKITEERMRKAKRITQRKAYHNTAVVLSHYRTIVWILECFPGEIADEMGVRTKDVDDLVSRIDYEVVMGNQRVEDRLRAVGKTRYLLNRVNDAIAVLRKKPVNGEQLYRIIYEAYIDPEERTTLDLIERMHMSARTYYRMKEEALAIISIRLWSAPSKDIDDWLELLALMEKF